MDFSELIKFSGQVAFSPDAKYLATTDKYRVFIRDSDSLEIKQIFTCLDIVSRLEWSSDSKYILCAQYKRRICQVFAPEQPSFSCKIDEGLSGLSYAQWTPDGQSVVTCSEFNLRLNLWNLVTKNTAYVKFPKYSDRGLDFSHDGKYMAVVERREFKDYIGIYHTESWVNVKHFQVESEDLAFIKWSPDNRAIAVVDTNLEYRILIYTPDGRKLAKYEAYENQLGIKCAMWSPSGQFLAVGSFDETARILNNITWGVVSELHHRSPITHNAVVVYAEAPVDESIHMDNRLEDATFAGEEDESAAEADNESTLDDGEAKEKDKENQKDTLFRKKLQEIQLRTKAAGSALGSSTSHKPSNSRQLSGTQTQLFPLKRELNSKEQLAKTTAVNISAAVAVNVPTKYVVSPLPVAIPQIRPDPEKPNPKLGVGLMAWSFNDHYLFTRNDNMPCSLWVWDAQRLALACVINQLQPIRMARWDPTSERIALCTDNGKLYMWSPQGCFIVDVPAPNFCVKNLRWNDDGKSLVLSDSDRFCCCYLQLSE